ncbi:MAG: 3-isopropylmalate dehydrogenase [Candidatus Omnitrophota bacterium]|jgi:3-isopropylmalate dehydrogenase
MSNRSYNIVLLPGDGIGPEVIAEAVKILDAVSGPCGFSLSYSEDAAGGAAIDQYDDPMPDSVVAKCKAAHGVMLGAVGGPKWDHHTGEMRPESGLLKIRRELGVFANLRPVAVPASLAEASPLRPEAVAGTDMLVVRELTGGIYFGSPKGRSGEPGNEEAFNTMRYTTPEIERVARVAFDWARKRRNKLCSVDKANVLVVSQLWRDVVTKMGAEEYPDVELSHMYVDNAAMQLVINPGQFDVIVTGNLFGDILSDAGATLGGSLGLLPSASLGNTKPGLFEPVHGSAPDIAGQSKANPIACILSAAMMLDDLGEEKAAAALRSGVEGALNDGLRTADLGRAGLKTVSTIELGEAILAHALKAL